jgi:hypothetical protein
MTHHHQHYCTPSNLGQDIHRAKSNNSTQHAPKRHHQSSGRTITTPIIKSNFGPIIPGTKITRCRLMKFIRTNVKTARDRNTTTARMPHVLTPPSFKSCCLRPDITACALGSADMPRCVHNQSPHCLAKARHQIA